jgi:hypothetical protein
LNFEFGAVAEYLDLLHVISKVLAYVSYKAVNVYIAVDKSQLLKIRKCFHFVIQLLH